MRDDREPPLNEPGPETTSSESMVDWSIPNPVTTSVAMALAEVVGEPPTEIPPLPAVVDACALEMLFGLERNQPANNGLFMTVVHYGHAISISENGRIRVCPVESDDRLPS